MKNKGKKIRGLVQIIQYNIIGIYKGGTEEIGERNIIKDIIQEKCLELKDVISLSVTVYQMPLLRTLCNAKRDKYTSSCIFTTGG